MNTNRIEQMKYLRFTELKTLQEIGNIFGISRERVRQLIGNSPCVCKQRINKAIKDFPNKTFAEIAEMLGLSEAYVKMTQPYKREKLSFDSHVGRGSWVEDEIANQLNRLGFICELQNHKGSYDILIDHKIRADVKSDFDYSKSPTLHVKSHQWRFQVRKNEKRKDCDFYICVIVPSWDVFIIPSKNIPENVFCIQFCWPTTSPRQSNWQQYHNRFDLLKSFKE